MELDFSLFNSPPAILRDKPRVRGRRANFNYGVYAEVFAKFRAIRSHPRANVQAREGTFLIWPRRVAPRPRTVSILERDLIVRFIVPQREIIRICRAIGAGRANPRAAGERVHRRGTTRMKFLLAFIAPRRFDCADFIGRPVYYGRNELPSGMTEPDRPPEPTSLPSSRSTSRRCRCASNGDEGGRNQDTRDGGGGGESSNHIARLMPT